MKALYVGVMVACLTGCYMLTPSDKRTIDVHCDALCTTPCDPLTGWDGDRDGDRLAALFDAHDVQLAQCEAHRHACVNCIGVARKAGAIK